MNEWMNECVRMKCHTQAIYRQAYTEKHIQKSIYRKAYTHTTTQVFESFDSLSQVSLTTKIYFLLAYTVSATVLLP